MVILAHSDLEADFAGAGHLPDDANRFADGRLHRHHRQTTAIEAGASEGSAEVNHLLVKPVHETHVKRSDGGSCGVENGVGEIDANHNF